MIAKAKETVWGPISEWLNRTTKVKYVLPAYLILALGFAFSWARLNDLNAERIQDQQIDEIQTEYHQCLTRVDTRDSIRAILLAITAQFPDSESVEVIVTLIQTEYPPLDAATTCGPILLPEDTVPET